MNIKEGVTIRRLKATLIVAANICKNAYYEHGYDFTITSTDEGVHKKGSLHYFGLAFDCRTHHLSKMALENITKTIIHRLNLVDERFQLVVEEDHLHIEYDRRRK